MQEVLFGIQPVREVLKKANRPIDCVLIASAAASLGISAIRQMCRDLDIPVKQSDVKKLDLICEGGNHQGVAAMVAAAEYVTLDTLFARAKECGESPFFVVCAGLEDPHNLGAITRTAEAAGAHGMIIPERRSVGLTAAVAKTAAGALEYLPVARVKNIAACIEELKARGVWLYGAEMGGAPYNQTNYSGAVGLVVGAEGKGLGQLIKSRCDFLVSLPMRGKIESLNVSVAAGILLYEIAKQRGG
ncbi:MAG: 23S rRNA (guanosine(2251)-2'-O)-methyltransferase RlmB [Oscillospiraceae bacterium]|jgi:23S rRNA (guanosine2251-2'-O)-methyltransferase|nr:23S rRNA (guanosine(2251)-2'-O)-methyltransferase RlmB [Oscillospiraceae bacterium]